MHKYLRAIGFSQFDRDNDVELEKFFDEKVNLILLKKEI